MTSIKLLILAAAICITESRTILDDPGAPSPTFDLNQGEVVMKEAILYLTPSQIKAYEASQGQANGDQRNQFTEEDILKVEAEIKRQLERQNIYAYNQNDNYRPVLKYPKHPPPVVEEPISENPLEYIPQYPIWKPLPGQQEEQKYFTPPQVHQQNHNVAQSYSYIKFYTDHGTHETPKLKFFHPHPHEEKIDPELAKFLEVQKDPLHNKKYKLIPYEYKTLEVPRLEDVQEITKLTTLLEKYNNEPNADQQKLFEPIRVQEQKDQLQKDLSELKYAPQFQDQKNVEDADRFYINIEKENALARAEAILKAPSSVVRKEVSIKRRPLPSYHGKERHNLPSRFNPERKREVPSEIRKSDKSRPFRYASKY